MKRCRRWRSLRRQRKRAPTTRFRRVSSGARQTSVFRTRYARATHKVGRAGARFTRPAQAPPRCTGEAQSRLETPKWCAVGPLFALLGVVGPADGAGARRGAMANPRGRSPWWFPFAAGRQAPARGRGSVPDQDGAENAYGQQGSSSNNRGGGRRHGSATRAVSPTGRARRITRFLVVTKRRTVGNGRPA